MYKCDPLATNDQSCMQRVLKKGQGWRMGWDPNAEVYQGLVGAEEWAIELTKAELTDFCRLLLQLAQTMEQMAQELVDEERITCQAQSELLWLEVEGYPHNFDLRLILETGRCAEGNWSVQAVLELITTAKNFQTLYLQSPSN